MRQIFSAGGESLLHVSLGALTVYTQNYWIAPALVLYRYGTATDDDTANCPNYIVQGAEYAAGYFGVMLLYQLYGGLQ
jgi:hypothetical protein